MEIRLIKDWKRGDKVYKKTTQFHVTNELGKNLIKGKIAKPVRDVLPFLAKLANKKSVHIEGTKQAAIEAKKKGIKIKQEED